jgi:hypothetical protein
MGYSVYSLFIARQNNLLLQFTSEVYVFYCNTYDRTIYTFLLYWLKTASTIMSWGTKWEQDVLYSLKWSNVTWMIQFTQRTFHRITKKVHSPNVLFTNYSFDKSVRKITLCISQVIFPTIVYRQIISLIIHCITIPVGQFTYTKLSVPLNSLEHSIKLCHGFRRF